MAGGVAAVCAGGSLGGFWEICRSTVGPSPATSMLFCGVVLMSVCLGALSPRWLVGRLTQVAARAPRWLRLKSGEQSLAVGLGAAMVLHAMLAVGAALTAAGLDDVYHWLDGRFLLGCGARRGLDALFMIALLGPAWFVAGVTLALVHRVALAAERDNQQQQLRCEWAGPVLLPAGLAVGHVVWRCWLGRHLGPLYSVWIWQIPVTVTAILLVALAPACCPPQSELKRGGIRGGGRSLLVVLLAALGGASVVVLKHLDNLLWLGAKQNVYAGVIFAGVIVGLLLVGRRTRKGRGDSADWMGPLLMAWAMCTLSAVVAFGRLWRAQVVVPWYAGSLWAGLVLVGVVLLTIGVGIGKQITQEAAVSKSRGWARWLMLLSVGSLAGWYIAVYQLLERRGSLTSLALLILVALLAGGLVGIYHKKTRGRRLVMVMAFVLAGVTSLVLPWLGGSWLQLPQSPAAAIIEAKSGAWGVYKVADDRVAIADLGYVREAGLAAAMAVSERNAYWTKMILPAISNERVLLVGLEDNVWPLPNLPEGLAVDCLLPGNLSEQLQQQKVGPVPTSRVKGGLRVIDTPLNLWARSRHHYNLVWQRVTVDHDGAAGDNLHWDGLARLLHPEGVLLIQLEHAHGNSAVVSEVAEQMAGRFEGRGGVFRPKPPAQQQSGAETETTFVVAFQSQGYWERYQRHNQSGHAGGADPPGSWKLYRIRGVFRRFGALVSAEE